MNNAPINDTRRSLLARVVGVGAATAFAASAANATPCIVKPQQDDLLDITAKYFRVLTARPDQYKWGSRRLLMPDDCSSIWQDIYSEKWAQGPNAAARSEHCLSTIVRINMQKPEELGSIARNDVRSYLLGTDNPAADPAALDALEIYIPSIPSVRVNNLKPDANYGTVLKTGPHSAATWPDTSKCVGADNPWEITFGLNATEWMFYRQNFPLLRQIVNGNSDPHSVAVLRPLGIAKSGDHTGKHAFSVDVYQERDNGTPFIIGATFSLDGVTPNDAIMMRSPRPSEIVGAYGTVMLGQPHDPAQMDTLCKVDSFYAGPSRVGLDSIMQGVDLNYK